MSCGKILVVSDVDGVLTDGSFLYDADGKAYKRFGAHDSDGLKLLKVLGIDVKFISADTRGEDITRTRIYHMGSTLQIIKESEREGFFESIIETSLYEKIYFLGDGIFDAMIMNKYQFSKNPELIGIAPPNAVEQCLIAAKINGQRRGGDGFFFEACSRIIIINDLSEQLAKLTGINLKTI